MTLDYAVARENMVENQVRTNDVTDLSIQDAMRAAPRERFCADRPHLAYAEGEIEYAPGLKLMAARDISKLLQALAPKPGETALALCAPYAAMVLAIIGLKVVLRVPESAAAAVRAALSGFAVEIEAGDPAIIPGGPYDLVVVEGAVPAAPKSWIDALAAGGRLGLVERSGPVGKARLYLQDEHARAPSRELFDATPSLLPGFAPEPVFAF